MTDILIAFVAGAAIVMASFTGMFALSLLLSDLIKE